MIRYTLRCKEGHQFESWFQSSAAYDGLAEKGLLTCSICGSPHVQKALMAPSVAAKNKPEELERKPLSKAPTPAEAKLKELRESFEKNVDYVGTSFASEARSMHLGETDARPIWGEAKPEEAKALQEEGVPVAPLPFTPRHKVN